MHKINFRINTPSSSSQEPPAKQPRLSQKPDVGAYIHLDKAVSDNNKYHLAVEHFSPEPTYNFPKSSNGRSFQHRWPLKYQWLRYSELDSGGYCLPCALFSRPAVNLRADPGVLVTKPLTNLQKALELLRKH